MEEGERIEEEGEGRRKVKEEKRKEYKNNPIVHPNNIILISHIFLPLWLEQSQY